MSLTPERTAELQELCRQYRIDVLTACLLYTSFGDNAFGRTQVVLEQTMCPEILAGFQNPVSYTHLDVYKRQ